MRQASRLYRRCCTCCWSVESYAPQWALPVAQPAFALRTVCHPFEVTACHEASITSVQALLHLLLECGELGATVGILWHSLRAYQPRALGWFRARARPLRAWLCPALLACAFFPLVDLAAARSQVRTLVLSWHRMGEQRL